MAADEGSSGDGPMPKIDLYGYGSNVDLRTVAPLYGVTSEEEPDYLDYDIKGRGTVEKMFLYSGSAYLTGILSGGVLGARTGWKAAPSPRFWIRLNSVMNGAGKYGSKWGNNMGVIGASRGRARVPAWIPRALPSDSPALPTTHNPQTPRHTSTHVLPL